MLAGATRLLPGDAAAAASVIGRRDQLPDQAAEHREPGKKNGDLASDDNGPNGRWAVRCREAPHRTRSQAAGRFNHEAALIR
jgi:hypothetical protein